MIEARTCSSWMAGLVAKPGEKSENPGIELGPRRSRAVIDSDRASFIKFAHGLHDAGMKALAAIDKKERRRVV